MSVCHAISPQTYMESVSFESITFFSDIYIQNTKAASTLQ